VLSQRGDPSLALGMTAMVSYAFNASDGGFFKVW
jgi:hypothetical protein